MSDLTCPWCGASEPNEMLLTQNHWVRPDGHTGYDWCAAHGMCIAMDLTRNHVLYMAKKPADVRSEQLPRYIERAREVWRHAGAGWLAEYESLARPLTAPEHRSAPPSEDADLFGGAA